VFQSSEKNPSAPKPGATGRAVPLPSSSEGVAAPMAAAYRSGSGASPAAPTVAERDPRLAAQSAPQAAPVAHASVVAPAPSITLEQPEDLLRAAAEASGGSREEAQAAPAASDLDGTPATRTHVPKAITTAEAQAAAAVTGSGKSVAAPITSTDLVRERSGSAPPAPAPMPRAVKVAAGLVLVSIGAVVALLASGRGAPEVKVAVQVEPTPPAPRVEPVVPAPVEPVGPAPVEPPAPPIEPVAPAAAPAEPPADPAKAPVAPAKKKEMGTLGIVFDDGKVGWGNVLENGRMLYNEQSNPATLKLPVGKHKLAIVNSDASFKVEIVVDVVANRRVVYSMKTRSQRTLD
jgi:hypothetical protein